MGRACTWVPGYRVIFVPFANGRPSGMPHDVLTGFVLDNGDAMGRPVGVAIARDGSLLVATMWETRCGVFLVHRRRDDLWLSAFERLTGRPAGQRPTATR